MYDSYGTQPHNFDFCETTDFKTFILIGCFNEGVMKIVGFIGPKYGVVISLIFAEVCKLVDKWKFGSF